MSILKKHHKFLNLLKVDELFIWLKAKFDKIPDTRSSNKVYKLGDCLMSGFAMFSLKDGNMLDFNNKRTVRSDNLKNVYKIGSTPSDSRMRGILDEVDWMHMGFVFTSLVNLLRQAGVWKGYEYFRGHLICSIDGVHHFSSEKISCKHCLEYIKSNGIKEYRHYMLSGAIVHPHKKEVMPVIHEPIIKQDGVEKNDCERNASKRLLPQLRAQFKREKLIIVEDALGANGPHIRAIAKEDFRYVIGVKPDGNKYLFDLVQRLEDQGKVCSYEIEKDGFIHKFSYVNDLPLNSENRDVRVNFIDYRQIDPRGKVGERHFSWITDFRLTKTTLYPVMRIGRSRWKIENETFNTLKNQGYNFEHNYGHGNNHLCTLLTLLMMLAFWVDQIQQGWNDFFKAAWTKVQTKVTLWKDIRGVFNLLNVASMEMIYRLIAGQLKVKAKFYDDSG